MRTEVRLGRWQHLGAGVFLTRPDTPTRSDWAQLGAALAGPSAVLTGWDVVRLRNIGPSSPPRREVIMIVPAGRRARRLGGVLLRPSARPLPSTRLSVLDDKLGGLRIALPARAVADTALDMHTLQPVRAMVTAAVQRGLCTPAELADELAAGPQNGSRWLRRSLQDAFMNVHSIAEAEAADALRRAGAPPFLANAEIRDAAGRLLFVVDLYWPGLRAVVEIDSREYHFSETDWKRTLTRHNALTALGHAVTHYAPNTVRADPDAWAAEIVAWLASRSAHLARG